MISTKRNYMQRAATLPKDRRRRGDVAEALFIAFTTAMGFFISRPFADNCRYDYILDWHGHLSRVQVKSSWTTDRNGNHEVGCICGTSHTRHYTRADIDFLVAFIADGTQSAQLDKVINGSWYVFPVDVISGSSGISVSAFRSRSKYAPYRNAWHLLQ